MYKNQIIERLQASTQLIKVALQLPDITYAIKKVLRVIEPVDTLPMIVEKSKELEAIRNESPKKANYETIKEYAGAIAEYKKQLLSWLEVFSKAIDQSEDIPASVAKVARGSMKGAAVLQGADGSRLSIPYAQLALELVGSKAMNVLLAGGFSEVQFAGEHCFKEFLKERGYQMAEGYEGSEGRFARNTLKAIKASFKLKPRERKGKKRNK